LSTQDLNPQVYVKSSKETIINGELINRDKILPESYFKYLATMGYVDKMNDDLGEIKYKHALHRYNISILLWIFTTIIHNSRIIYNKLNESNLTINQFTMLLSMELAPITEHEHILCKSNKQGG
jgi:hypothetical protein